MDINLLKTFIEVRQTRHFGQAAENLFVTQAAVSSRIKQLEDELGAPLFLRVRNNIQLTSEGERFAPYAENLLLIWTRAKQEMVLPISHNQQISIGATPALCHYVLQSKLGEIQANNPNLVLRLEAKSVEELGLQMHEGNYDLVILYESPRAPELSAKTLGKLKLVLLSSDDSIEAKQAVSQNYIYVDWGNLFEMFHKRKFGEHSTAFTSTNMASLAEEHLRNNKASAYLPELLVKNKTEKTLRIIDKSPSFSRDVYAIYNAKSEKINLIKNIISEINFNR